jgi:vitamin-K-epoxide reductase (warfarin-sensitive)
VIGAAIIGLGFALYLTHIEKDVLMVWCLYCVTSQIIIAVITLLAAGWAVAERIGRKHASDRV